jgi:hypothetical protein
MDLLEASMKVGRVVRSAQNHEQYQAAQRYRDLWTNYLKRENDKFHPVQEAVLLAVISVFALIGVITVMYFVTH